MVEDGQEGPRQYSEEESRQFAEENSPEELQRIEEEKARLEAQYEERKLDVATKAERLQEKIKEKKIELERVMEELEKLKEELAKKQEGTLQKLFSLLEIRALREKIGAQSMKGEELQREFDGLWVLYDDLQRETRSKVELDKAEGMVGEFYADQAQKLEAHEKDKQARDVTNVSREHKAVLTHSFLSWKGAGQVSVMKRGVSWKDMMKAVLAFEPDISTASVRLQTEQEKKPDESFFEMGALLKGGEIKAAAPRDVGTQVSGGGRKTHWQSSDIEREIGQAINKPTIGHNEIVVQKPKVAALFFDSDIYSALSQNASLTESGNFKLKEEMFAEGQKLGMPVYERDKETGQYFLVKGFRDETVNEGFDKRTIRVTARADKPANIDDILNSQFDLNTGQREAVEREVLEGDVYNLNLPERKNFASWSYARRIYQNLEINENSKSRATVNHLDLSGNSTGWETKAGYKDNVTYLDALEELILREKESVAGLEKKIESGEKTNQHDVSLVELLNFAKDSVGQIIWHTWGIADAAEKVGDVEIQKRAAELAAQFVSLEEKQEMLSRRLADNGNFRMTADDLKHVTT